MSRFVSVILVSILLALGGVYLYLEKSNTAAVASVDQNFKPKINAVTSASVLPNKNDVATSFSGKQDKLQLINFWASWCGPCILEAPDLVKLHENYSDQLTLYAVNSTKYDREREARSFIDEYGFEFEVLFDRDGVYTDLYKVNTYPTSFIVDTEGVIRERINGVIPYEEWERIIAKWAN